MLFTIPNYKLFLIQILSARMANVKRLPNGSLSPYVDGLNLALQFVKGNYLLLSLISNADEVHTTYQH